MHVYEVSKRMVLMEPVTEVLTTNYDDFNKAVEELVSQAKIDILAEGLPLEDVIYQVELDMLYGGQVHVKRVSSPHVQISSKKEMQEVYDSFESEFSAAFSPHVVYKPGGVFLDNIVLKATIPTEKMHLPEFPLEGEDPVGALKNQREAYWPELRERRKTAVYSFESLKPGNCIEGPSLVEAEFTTLVIPPGQYFHIDSRGIGLLEYSSCVNDSEERA
jgi:N-methylhydantoinase A/oxoprolinase/acetone carboxylase beta subunit